MNRTQTTTVLFFSVLLSQQVIAHPGHDHSHWMSDGIHALAWLAVASAVGVGIWFYRNRRLKIKAVKQKRY